MSEETAPSYILGSIFKILVRLIVPVILFFLIIWQAIYHAKLNREIKKMTHQKEELYKKNYDLKAKIISNYSDNRIENLYNQKYNSGTMFSKDRIITLTLPQEKIHSNLNE
ncbi:MAG: hypothetical protein KDK36_01595 [Leptospiraceae bacterium]|nr:hypothetical protein [Leptospiraceae bacterium]